MFKLMRSLKCIPIRKRNLMDHPINAKFEEIFTIRSIEEFNERIKNRLPVIVNFSATWCSNCKILTPLIEMVIRENSGNIVMLKVDVDDHIDLAMDYRVVLVPTLIVINNGHVKDMLVGMHEIEKIRKWIGDFIKQK